MTAYRIFLFILFGGFGAFNILAAVLDRKWYINYWLNRWGRPRRRIKSRAVLRVCIGLIGALFLTYGIAALLGLL